MNNILRNFIIFSLVSFFILLYPLSAIIVSASVIQTDPVRLKSVLHDSGVYGDIGPIAKNLLINQKNDSPFLQEVVTRLENPADPMSGLINDFLKEENLQYNAENFVDAFYLFLQGKSDAPVVKLRIVKDSESASLLLKLLLVEKVRSLPECGSTELPLQGGNAFNLNCRPVELGDTDIDALVANSMEAPEAKEVLNQLNKSEVPLDFSGANKELIRQAYKAFDLSKFVLPAIIFFIFGCATLLAANKVRFLSSFSVIVVALSLVTYYLMSSGLGNLITLLIIELNDALRSQQYLLSKGEIVSAVSEFLKYNERIYLMNLSAFLAVSTIFVLILLSMALLVRYLRKRSNIVSSNEGVAPLDAPTVIPTDKSN